MTMDQAGDDPGRLFEAGADRAAYVRRMFGEIAARYDLINRLMTLGQDLRWRRLAADAVVRAGDTVVDAGSGTGDLAFACLEAGAARVIGVDVAAPMLARAQTKARASNIAARAGFTHAGFTLGDATRLPLADGSVDVWCSAFVVRNIPDLDVALREALRVLRPGGRLAVLEIPRMTGGWQQPLARFHFTRVVPRLGRWLSGHASAFDYLPVSVDHFLTPREFTAHLAGLGFEVTAVRLLMFGTVALHVARKPLPGEPRARQR